MAYDRKKIFEQAKDVIVKRMIKLDPTLIVKRNGVDETKKWLDKTLIKE